MPYFHTRVRLRTGETAAFLRCTRCTDSEVICLASSHSLAVRPTINCRESPFVVRRAARLRVFRALCSRNFFRSTQGRRIIRPSFARMFSPDSKKSVTIRYEVAHMKKNLASSNHRVAAYLCLSFQRFGFSLGCLTRRCFATRMNGDENGRSYANISSFITIFMISITISQQSRTQENASPARILNVTELEYIAVFASIRKLSVIHRICAAAL